MDEHYRHFRVQREAGQVSLFDLGGDDGGTGTSPDARPAPKLPEVAPWPEAERLKREKEILGFFISGHPLDKYREELRVFEGVNTANLKEHRDRRVELPCVVTSVSRQISRRNGNEWGRLTIEDFYGTATVLAFGEQWEKHRDELTQDAVVLLRGMVSGRDRDEDDPPMFLDDAIPLARIAADGTLALELRLAPGAVAEPDQVARATQALRSHQGGAQVFVVWPEPNGGPEDAREHRLRSRSLAVEPSPVLLEELRDVFGRERVRLIRGSNGEARMAGRTGTGGD